MLEVTQQPLAEDAGPRPEAGIALCLSGGGYRAMVFHLGCLWRLYEAGLLQTVAQVSSVSGGSITAAFLALKWRQLVFEPPRVREDFELQVVMPVRALASTSIDIRAIFLGVALPGRVSDRVVSAYENHLFGSATLQDLPDIPRFVINATNVQSGVLWRFMKPYMRDYRVGEVRRPTVRLSQAVAASSAFPPFLSPVELKLDAGAYTPGSGLDLQKPPYTTNVILSDAGVYDNLGLETAWKRYDTILVSDGGGKMGPQAKPWANWLSHSKRVLDVVDNQVRALRKRQLIDSFKLGARKGAYWGIRTNIADYGLDSALPCPHASTMVLAETPTRLKAMPSNLQERLINWGYAASDAALRRHVDPGLPQGHFPYPGSGV